MQTIIRAKLSLPLLALLLSLGCASSDKPRPVTLRIHEQVSAGLPNSHVVTVAIPRHGLRITINPNPTLTESAVQAAELVETASGASVMLRFDIHGTMILDEMTTRDRGQYLVVMLDGAPAAAWFVDRRLSLGQFLLDGDFTVADARRLVDSFNAMAHDRPTW